MLARFRHAALAALLLLALTAGLPLGAAAPAAAKAKAKHKTCHVVRSHGHRTKVCRHAKKHKNKAKKHKPAKHQPAKKKAPAKKLAATRPASSPARTEATTSASPQNTPAPAGRLFSPNSVWNAALPASAPVDPSSGSLVTALASEARSEFTSRKGPWIATTSSSTPIFTVPANQPTVAVALDDPTAGWRAALAGAFSAVPMPAGAKAAAGPDGHMTVWQPSTDRLWEFFQARKDPSGTWHASWGGAIAHVSSDPGYYSTSSWAGSGNGWGATASSLPVAAGVMRIAELRTGHIDHALAMNVPWARKGAYSWPAQRTDGKGTDVNALPEGAHLRLDPKLDIAKLGLPPMVRMMAVAAQKYGIIVRDQTGWAIGFFGEDPAGGADPYQGASGFFGNTPPNYLMDKFPWEKLQVLKMTLHPQA